MATNNFAANTTTFPTRYADVALTLCSHGWAPVPLHPASKVPNRREWQYRPLLSLERLRQEILRELSWRDAFDRRDCACGIVIPVNVLCVDCDLLDATASDTVRGIMRETLGKPLIGRIGNPKKWLAMYGVTGSGVFSRKLGGVELFCGSGQIAAFGVHEKTGRPYHWSAIINPLNVRPEDIEPKVAKPQADEFVRCLIAAGVLTKPVREGWQPGTDGKSSYAGRDGGGCYPATERLRVLINAHDGMIRPAVTALITEIGADHAGRHNAIVAITGFLVRKRWVNAQITTFLTPLVNQHFREGDWSVEVERGIAHARDRSAMRRTMQAGGQPPPTNPTAEATR
jgi:hypothetical protein